MKINKLKEVRQETFLTGGGPSKDGICYYMCNFVESNEELWLNPLNFKNAVDKATNFKSIVSMINYAKVNNVQKYEQNFNYHDSQFIPNYLFRVAVCIDVLNGNISKQNHELILITNEDCKKIVFFDPNFGFYTVEQDVEMNQTNGKKNISNTAIFEAAIKQKYQTKNMDASNFIYCKVRPIHKKSRIPLLSFKTKK